jgi:hypothetical protein|tara:strand:+ start:291 stop:515 length:225 start_codon:yes stop_codon:yes gene_type:complete
MPKNKLKEKVDAMTSTMKRLIEDFIKLDQLSRGTLTALQLYIGEEEWNKVMKELQDRELEAQKEQKPEEKKLEL